jgi:hypothetical protein
MPQLLSLAIVSGKLVSTTPLPDEGFAERGLSVGGQGLANSRHFSNLAWGSRSVAAAAADVRRIHRNTATADVVSQSVSLSCMLARPCVHNHCPRASIGASNKLRNTPLSCVAFP